jgi:ABC-type antimicrobial peptide transport system permease subunit
MGVYGLVAYTAEERTRELGIRSAVGATRGQLAAVVFGDGARLIFFGLLLGLPLALGATRLMASFLFATAPWDPMSFAVAGLAVIVAMAAASLVPALRASGGDVTGVLRQS